MLGLTEARLMCEKVLQRNKGAAGEVTITCTDEALTRFANNTIHQNVAEHNVLTTVRCAIGKCVGTAQTNRLDSGGLDEVFFKALQNAYAATEDADFPGLPEPVAISPSEAFDSATANYSPAMRARAVGLVCRLAEEKGLAAFGALTTGYIETAICNTSGVFAYHLASQADFQVRVMSDDSAGHAQASGWRMSDIPIEALGREAIEKADLGRNPQIINPGEYCIVCNPYVTADMVSMLAFTGMSGQAVLEGRSWMCDRFDQQIMHPTINIRDDGLDERGIPSPFDSEGMPRQQVNIIQDGVAKSPVYDRYTAQKAGKPSTGHAMPSSTSSLGPMPANLFMASGTTSTADLIRSTERGLYITRFWYTRPVHPRDCVVTGMTRDGVFMIENGEITYPVKNLRFTQSYVQALADLEALGSETRLLSAWNSLVLRVPALKMQRFNFTGITV